MLKLYYLPGACSLVPHVALEWSGLDYVAEKVTHESTKTTEYLALNPRGQVPLLVDGDWTLTENMAIIDYIHDLAPNKGIFGIAGTQDQRARAKSRQWLAFANSDLHPSFAAIFGAARMVDDKNAQNDLTAKARNKIISLFASVNDALNKHNYLDSDNISIADVYVYVVMRWSQACKIDLSQYNNLVPYYQRVETNTGINNVLKAQGLI